MRVRVVAVGVLALALVVFLAAMLGASRASGAGEYQYCAPEQYTPPGQYQYTPPGQYQYTPPGQYQYGSPPVCAPPPACPPGQYQYGPPGQYQYSPPGQYQYGAPVCAPPPPPPPPVPGACQGQTPTIVGTPGHDIINGTSGPDVINGLAGNDLIKGNGGNDTICGDIGNDTIDGGAGADVMSGGDGADSASYVTRTTPVTVDIDGVADDGNASDGGASGDNVLADMEHLIGGSAGDTLTGSPAVNTLSGRGGGDTLNGLNGNDTLDGGAGSDWMIGGGGLDTVTYATRINNVIVDIDGLPDDGEAGELDNVDLDVENVYGGDGDDTLIGTILLGNTVANGLYGYDGDDVLEGREGNDRLYGGDGTDQLKGEAGNDALDGGLDGDDLDGGAGIDSATWASRTGSVWADLDDVADDGEGSGAEGDNARSTLESLIGGFGNDTLQGNAAANRLTGNSGNDVLDGLAGADILSGGVGDDLLISREAPPPLFVDSDQCGAGVDTVDADELDTVGTDCENVEVNITADFNAVTGMGDGLKGIAVGDGGVVYTTANAGLKWTPRASGTANGLNGVSLAAASNTGWAAGNIGTIRKTGTAGTTWAAQVSGTIASLQDVHAVSASVAWAVGDLAGVPTIVKTTNGGTSWTAFAAPPSCGLTSVVATAGQVFVGDICDTVYVSGAGAPAWTTLFSLPPAEEVTDVTLSNGSLYAVGLFGTIAKYPLPAGPASFTSAAGYGAPPGFPLNGVASVSSTTVVTAGANHVVRTTSSGGAWARATNGSGTCTLQGVAFIGGGKLLVVGTDGVILRSLDSGATFTDVSGPGCDW